MSAIQRQTQCLVSCCLAQFVLLGNVSPALANLEHSLTTFNGQAAIVEVDLDSEANEAEVSQQNLSSSNLLPANSRWSQCWIPHDQNGQSWAALVTLRLLAVRLQI